MIQSFSLFKPTNITNYPALHKTEGNLFTRIYLYWTVTGFF